MACRRAVATARPRAFGSVAALGELFLVLDQLAIQLVDQAVDRGVGILTFGVKGGLAAGGRFQDALGLFTRLVNIGDVRSLACHPASTTHRQLSPAELARAGVSEDMIRLSIGIEHIDDLIADLDQALTAA